MPSQNESNKADMHDSTTGNTENTLLAGSDGEDLLQDLLDDIDVMYTYARQRGISLSSVLLGDISRLLVRTKDHREVKK